MQRFLCMTALAAAVALTSCSLGGPGTVEAMRERSGAADGVRVYDSLDDLLGNTRYQFGDAAEKPLTVAVVAGRFASVKPGRAFTVPGGDAPAGRVADFDADDAVWKTAKPPSASTTSSVGKRNREARSKSRSPSDRTSTPTESKTIYEISVGPCSSSPSRTCTPTTRHFTESPPTEPCLPPSPQTAPSRCPP